MLAALKAGGIAYKVGTRAYHIKNKRRRNIDDIHKLGVKIDTVETLLNQFRQAPEYADFVVSVDQTLTLARDYINKFNDDSFYQKGLRLFYVDRLGKEISENSVDISDEIELALLKIVGQLFSVLSQKETDSSLTVSTLTPLNSQINALNHSIETFISGLDEVNGDPQSVETDASVSEQNSEGANTDAEDYNGPNAAKLAQLVEQQQRLLGDFSQKVQDIIAVVEQKVNRLALDAQQTKHELSNVSAQVSLLSSAQSAPMRVEDAQFSLIRDRLKRWYQRDETALVRLDVGEETRTIRVDELFINLAIVEEDIKKEQERALSAQQYQNAVDAEAGGSNSSSHLPEIDGKQVIKIENLFNAQTYGTWRDIPSRLLMLGRAGVGKTTLCNYQTYRWATDDLWLGQIQWIFNFQLKKVANHRKLEDEQRIHRILYEMILCHFPELILENQVETFWQSLLQSQQPILFILDGYDEVSDRQHPACEALMSVISHYAHISSLKVLITSRPYARIDEKMDMILENIGFMKEDIPLYVEKYFQYSEEERPSDSKSRSSSNVTLRHASINAPLKYQLIDWLNDRPKIRQICSVPIHLELLCSVWQMNADKLMVSDVVMSDLYAMMIEKIVRRYLRKTLTTDRLDTLKLLNSEQVMSLDESQEILTFLKQLAYRGLITGNIIIQKNLFKIIVSAQGDAFQQKGVLQRLLSTGFLKAVGNFDDDPLEMDYHFIHLSFQEYLTACYLSDSLLAKANDKEIKDFILDHRYDPTYQLVWTYVANLLSHDKTALRRYFRLLLSAPRDIFGMYELELLVRCGEEAKWPDIPIMQSILQYLGSWTISMSKLDVEKNPHERHFLRHMIELYHACPHAMSLVQHKNQHGLLNLLMYESRNQVWIDTIEKMLAVYATFAGLGFELVFYAKKKVSAMTRHNMLNDATNILLSPLYGLIKVISFCLHAAIFLIGNIPLLLFLRHMEYARGIQRNVKSFMQQFEFNDRQAVTRSLLLLKHPDPQLRLRIVKALASVRFSPEIFPHVTRSLLSILNEEPDFTIRQACYQQLVNKLSSCLTHNEALRFFNYSLHHFCQQRFSLFRQRLLERALEPFYPNYIVSKAVFWLKYSVEQQILFSLPLRDSVGREFFFCLDGLKVVLSDYVPVRDRASLFDALLPLLAWQYADIVEPEYQKQFIQGLCSSLSQLKDEELVRDILATVEQAMIDKKLSPELIQQHMSDLRQALQVQCPHLTFDLTAIEYHSEVSNDVEQGIADNEIAAFNVPYQSKVASSRRHTTANTQESLAAPTVIADTLSPLSTELENASNCPPIENVIARLSDPNISSSILLMMLKNIDPRQINEDNKAPFAKALLECAIRTERRRYRYYFLPRKAFGYIVAPVLLYFMLVTLVYYFFCRTGVFICPYNHYSFFLSRSFTKKFLFSGLLLGFIIGVPSLYFVIKLTIKLFPNRFPAYNTQWGASYLSHINSVQLYLDTPTYSLVNGLLCGLMDKAINIFSFNYTSRQQLLEYTQILSHIEGLLKLNTLFSAILNYYPKFSERQSQAVFYFLLREKLALYGTALVPNDKQLTWYKGRQHIDLAPKHYKQLAKDAKRARLTAESFSWLSVLRNFVCCQRQQSPQWEDASAETENPIVMQMNATFFTESIDGNPGKSFDVSIDGAELKNVSSHHFN